MPKPRARELGLPFGGTPGPLNAITDVPGVEVGHATLILGEGPLVVGQGPVRTGVTAVLPGGKSSYRRSFPAGFFSLNGNGEMTGVHWIEEAGLLTGPVLSTNTHSVGAVHQATIEWGLANGFGEAFSLPIVAETYDGFLNDINGFHVRREHVWAALDGASSGPVAEGNVGGGTGMRVSGFKGGIGTASRRLERPYPGGEFGLEGHTLGVLVQANYGARGDLTICGVPVGPEFLDLLPEVPDLKDGSIIIVVATDAPLLPHQLKRVARRAAMGLARTGSVAYNGSGDLFLAFSTVEPLAADGLRLWRAVPEGQMDALFKAAVQATEEAIVNALMAAETMTGLNGRVVHALPHDRLLALMRKYNRA